MPAKQARLLVAVEVLELIPLRSLRRDARVQRETEALGHFPALPFRLRRQRLQREDLLALSRSGRDPVRDRRAEQTVDRRLPGIFPPAGFGICNSTDCDDPPRVLRWQKEGIVCVATCESILR